MTRLDSTERSAFLTVRLAQANGISSFPSLSADGRLVVFESPASNLVAGDTNNAFDIFLRDRTSGATARVSILNGGGQSDRGSYNPSISGDGRYVAFESDGVLNGLDLNGKRDIYVQDRLNNSTQWVSFGIFLGTGASYDPSLSGDGRFVAFQSYASDLIFGDGNGVADVFVKDLVGAMTRASVSSTRAEANGVSATPADGRYVAFQSSASNLVSGDTNGVDDVFVKDLVGGGVVRASPALPSGELLGGRVRPAGGGRAPPPRGVPVEARRWLTGTRSPAGCGKPSPRRSPR